MLEERRAPGPKPKIRPSVLASIQEEASAEASDEARWLFSLSDLLTLLLTFFVMLFAISVPDQKKLSDMMAGYGGAKGGAKKAVTGAEDPEAFVKKHMKSLISDNNLVNDIDLTSDSRGVVLFSRGDFFFPSGTAELLPDTRLFLDKVSEIIMKVPNTVLVEGHTDDVPTSTAMFPSNWELSTARAAAVVKYFVQEKKIDPKRFIVSGYGEFKPRLPVTPENRSKNRRVEIVIMTSEKK